ncbi:neural/ectodermal development factor IMP-L2 [Halyomorpha halys]|uniref:neural/ectodermal development factor IMP-L2 n=1 Tax=Halyomorpha halys TaxID=286706 RepID=UPI0006D4DBE5|nr:neural/ectodermal development factor IMP-L2 [Halyomorpha halys]
MDQSMMDSIKVTLTVFAALLSLAAGRTHFPGHFHAALTQENTLSPMGSNTVSEREESMKDWVKISETERTIRIGRGQRLEVDCEAIGSPSPRIQWHRGSRPVTQLMEEDNVVRGFGLAKIVRTYVADCASPSHEGEYTCTAISGGETAISTPTRVIVDDDMRTECSPGTPKISVWAPIVMQTMGSEVRIPCRVHGIASVSWVNKDGHLISNAPGSRFRVLESGDLEITKLKWADMGKYSCYAENEIGKDTVSTFLYPMLSEN